MSTAVSLDKRNRETVAGACAVVVNSPHWGCVSVHSFRWWRSVHTVETWCGIEVGMPDAPSGAAPATGRLTKDLITCSGCRTGSLDAMRTPPAF